MNDTLVSPLYNDQKMQPVILPPAFVANAPQNALCDQAVIATTNATAAA
ncbi:MAG TPA: hypothetical protein VEI25_09285 [Paraburkholderia sp.]|nr:hypothetical protein [Paraburkholderia sp.]